MVKGFRVKHPFQFKADHQPEKIALVHDVVVILERIYQRGVTRRDRKGQIVHADQALLFQRRRQDEPFVKQLQPFAAAGIDFHIGAAALDQHAAGLARQSVRRRELHRRAGLQPQSQFPNPVFQCFFHAV